MIGARRISSEGTRRRARREPHGIAGPGRRPRPAPGFRAQASSRRASASAQSDAAARASRIASSVSGATLAHGVEECPEAAGLLESESGFARPQAPQACRQGPRRRADPGSAGRAARRVLNAGSAGSPRDFRCRPTICSAEEAVAGSACRTSCRNVRGTGTAGPGCERSPSSARPAMPALMYPKSWAVRFASSSRPMLVGDVRCAIVGPGSSWKLSGGSQWSSVADEVLEECPGLARDPAQEAGLRRGQAGLAPAQGATQPPGDHGCREPERKDRQRGGEGSRADGRESGNRRHGQARGDPHRAEAGAETRRTPTVPRTGSTRAVRGAQRACAKRVRSTAPRLTTASCGRQAIRIVDCVSPPPVARTTADACRPRRELARLAQQRHEAIQERRDGDEADEGESPGPGARRDMPADQRQHARALSAPGCAAGCRRSSRAKVRRADSVRCGRPAAGTRGNSQLTICQSPRIQRSCRRTSLA